MNARGFILQASYRIRDRVPVVHLFGRLEGGETFLVRDRRRTPSFYVAAANAARARDLGATRQCPTSRRTFGGAGVTRIDVQTPPDAPALRDRLHAQGIDTFEADVRFAVGFLIDHNIRGGLEIDGHAKRGEGVDWVFDDPKVAPAEVEVEPTILSFDIETDPEARRLLAISLYGRDFDEVYIVDSSGREMPEHAIACVDEAAALAAFCGRVAEVDPDILTGWNVVDFDLRVLSRIAARVRRRLDLGREPGSLRILPARGYFGSGQASIPGRLVLDGMDLVRGAFARFDDYSLETVSRAVLGEGKAVEGDVRDRADEIIRRYRTDLEGFALYARTDSRLALEIISEMRLVPLALARSRLTGMQPDRVSASIASFDFVYLAELHKRDIVAPTARSGDARVSASQTGGHVLEPTTGLHRNVWVFDFKSLYPSVMRTFNIDPLAFVAGVGAGEDVIRTTTGAAFRRGDAILPQMLDRLAEARDAAKRAADDIASQAIKILMNSFYGVLGTPACRFHNPAIANAITGQSRHFLLWSKAWFEAEGFDVLYGDTDSLFVLSGLADSRAGYARGEDLVRKVNAAIARHIRDAWDVESRLELEFEKFYTRLFLPSVRHGSAGARKRYTGVPYGGDAAEFVGMEAVRRDWTDLAKTVQRELYARLFADASVDDYLAQVVREVRGGGFDDALVYRKGLRKDLKSYTANTPPHVAAARKARSDPGRLISYVMTRSGPEPLDNITAELDREHYVQKQVRPVAEPVLDTFGLSFEQAIGDDRQLELF